MNGRLTAPNHVRYLMVSLHFVSQPKVFYDSWEGNNPMKAFPAPGRSSKNRLGALLRARG